MKFTTLALLLFVNIQQAQELFTLSGYIKDADTGEVLSDASIYFEGTEIGTVSNVYGFFSLSALTGDYALKVSYMGYKETTMDIELDADRVLEISLKNAGTQLDEVVLTAKVPSSISVEENSLGTVSINPKKMKEIPVVLGESDIIRTLQLLPGVTNTGEISNGFNVRGGSADQNLMLLDEAIIYNTSHLFGLVSVFNPDALRDVRLFKGIIPANYGGRGSSVLDIRQKEGNKKGYEFHGGLGVVAARFSAEGPLVQDKASFLVAARTSFANLVLSSLAPESRVGFYDFNFKTNYQFNSRNTVFLSGYFGQDSFAMDNSFENSYGNASWNIRWNHVFSDRLFSNLSAISSSYDYMLQLDLLELQWKSSINNTNLKYDFKYYVNDRLRMDFGASTLYYAFNPGEVRPTADGSATNETFLDKKRATENAIYISFDYRLSNRFSFDLGLRQSFFNRLGGQPIALYEDNLPVRYNGGLDLYEPGTVTEIASFEKSQRIANYSNLEPRISISYAMAGGAKLKAGFSRIAQYIHLISNTNSINPLDVWAPSGKYLLPKLTDQYAMGYSRDFLDNRLTLQLEGYFNQTKNMLDYIDGADLIANNTIETELISGNARAYGLEVLLQKNQGRWKGWLAYTLSKSEQRTLGGQIGGPGINDGNWYRSATDRTHDLSLNLTYLENERWKFGANLVYQTGRPTTFPMGQFNYENRSIAIYSERNSDRLPAYHRLDLSAIHTPRKKADRKWQGEWVFTIYNAYNRKNAASLSFGQNGLTGDNEAIRTSIFGMIPSVTYNFKF